MADKATFGIVDYVVFSASLLLSMSIGVFTWWKSRGLDNKDFLMGGGNMSPIPVAISLFAGIVSAVSILGNSSEMFYYGSQLWMNVVGTVFGVILCGILIVPVIYPLKIISIYEIIELRWKSPLARKLATVLQLINYLTYLGIALYAPSLALSSVTPIDANVSVIVLGIVCTIYASIGGAKGVVYTDTVQAFIMLAGIIVVIIQGCYEVGGGAKSWKIDEDDGRIEFFNLSTDPLERHTLMSTLILGIYTAFGNFGTAQSQYQRWASVATIQQSYFVLSLSCFILVAIWSLINYAGLVVYSVYADCDPLTAGYIEKSDQVMAYFVIDKLGYLSGIPGLFVAAVYSGVLSSVSSVLNAMAAMVWEDLLRNRDRFSNYNAQQEKRVTIIISTIVGIIATGMGLLSGSMGGLFQIAYSLGGAIGGPITGLIVTAVTCPWVKSQSAIIGILTSISLTSWMVVGSFLDAPAATMLPVSIDGCPGQNVTTVSPFTEFTTMPLSSTTDGSEDPGSDVFPLYLVTYCLYGAIGILTTMFVSNIATLIFGPMDIDEVQSNTVHKPCMDFYRWILGKTPQKDDSNLQAQSKNNDSDSIQLKDNIDFEKGSVGGNVNPSFDSNSESNSIRLRDKTDFEKGSVRGTNSALHSDDKF